MFLCCLIDYSLMKLWWFFDKILMISMQTLMTNFFFAKLGKIDVSIPLPWWFVDDAFERHCWNIDKFVGSFFELYCFWCVNLRIIEFTLLVHWRFVDDSLKKHWRYSEDFDARLNDLFGFFWPNLQNIDVSLLLRRWFLTSLWRELFETLTKSMENFLIFIVFVVLTSKSLMFHCFLIDDSLMTLWRNIDDTTNIWMQTLKIIQVSNVIIIRTLMFLCCLIDSSLMILWWFFDKILMILMQTLMTKFFSAKLGNIDVSQYRFLDDSLMMLSREIVETLMSS